MVDACHVGRDVFISDTISRQGLVCGRDDQLSVPAALDVDEGHLPGVRVVRGAHAPAQHFPRPSLNWAPQWFFFSLGVKCVPRTTPFSLGEVTSLMVPCVVPDTARHAVGLFIRFFKVFFFFLGFVGMSSTCNVCF